MLIPVAAKAAKLTTVGRISEETSEEVGKALAEAAREITDKIIDPRIAEFDEARQSIEAFRAKLSELAGSNHSPTGHPLVLFIDELDRCRPDFAAEHWSADRTDCSADTRLARQLSRAANSVCGSV